MIIGIWKFYAWLYIVAVVELNHGKEETKTTHHVRIWGYQVRCPEFCPLLIILTLTTNLVSDYLSLNTTTTTLVRRNTRPHGTRYAYFICLFLLMYQLGLGTPSCRLVLFSVHMDGEQGTNFPSLALILTLHQTRCD